MTKKWDFLVVGELNADLILRGLPSLPELGKEKVATDMTLTMGSASAILACNLARLEHSVGFIGKLGRDVLGDLVLAKLRERKVDTSLITIDSTSKTGITVVLTFPKEYAMATFMGAMAEFQVSEIDFSALDQARHLHLSSYYLQPGLRPGLVQLFSAAKQRGLSTSLDPGWDPAEEWREDILTLLPFVDIFLPNEAEACHIGGNDDLVPAVTTLSQYSHIVVVTRGNQGVYCSSGNQIWQLPVFPVEVVDTTGAGDSFNAGFLTEYLRSQDIPASLRSGLACGALAVTRMGGSEAAPNPQELAAFLTKHGDTCR